MDSIILSTDGGACSVNYSDEILPENLKNFKPLAASTPIRNNESCNFYIRYRISDDVQSNGKKGDGEGMEIMTNKETSSGSPIYPCDGQRQDESVILIDIKEEDANRMTKLKLNNSGRATSHKSSINKNQGDKTAEIAKQNCKRKSDSENNDYIISN